MQNKKFLIIGGSRGIGLNIVNHFKGTSVSRANGYDIKAALGREKIAKLSLNYNVVVNHAYAGDLSQLLMLREICLLWKEQGKRGYIIHTGSMSSYRFNDKKDEKWWLMAAAKKGSDEFVNYISQAAAWRKDIKFRITNIIPGMLDTPKDRKKPHFKAGITGKDYCQLIEYLLSTPENLIVSEVVLEAKSSL